MKHTLLLATALLASASLRAGTELALVQPTDTLLCAEHPAFAEMLVLPAAAQGARTPLRAFP